MKILLVNYRYFVSGGPEKYMFNVTRELEKRGHEVIPFSIHSNRNVETPYSKYFVEPIGGRDATYYEDCKKTPRVVAQMISRSFYSPSVARALGRLIDDTKPDLVYVLHYVNKLSPSVLRAAHKRGLPVVLRLSDYFLLCPRFDFLRGSAVCEECLARGLGAAVRHRCVKGSLMASLIRVGSMRFHKLIRVYDSVSAYVAPSAFLGRKLAQAGFPADRIHHIPTFTELGERPTPSAPGAYGLYFGRLAKEKGLDSLLEAYAQLSPGHELWIAGDDTSPEGAAYRRMAEEKGLKHVRFAGFLTGESLQKMIEGARFVIIPSIWYDNLPNTALEAMRYAKPILASDIGSLPELVKEGENGMLFPAGNAAEIARCVLAMDDGEMAAACGAKGRALLGSRFSPDAHMNALLKLFDSLVR